MNNTDKFEFHALSKAQLMAHTNVRMGETKLGEVVQTNINESTRVVILGISEDIGPRANHGNSGAQNAFDCFLSRFLNMQSNRFLHGESISIVGSVQAESNLKDLGALRTQVKQLDSLVLETLSALDLSNKQLIVIGGGHNNAYPIIKSLSAQHSTLNILNIDPHADCRTLEGRHSGNPFSAALHEHLINSYTVFGLHQQYNSEAIYDFLEENKCFYTFFEDYLDGRSLMEDLSTFISEKGQHFGLEIDMDAFERMPSSAFTPSGFSVNSIRTALRALAIHHPIYLHLPEAAPLSGYDKKIAGKTLAYLVSDFIKKTTK